MPTTPIYALPYPAAADPADVPTDMGELAARIETVLAPPTPIAITTFTNGWANAALPNAPVTYYKDSFNRVHLEGEVIGGTIGTAAFGLPTGYRPANYLFFAAHGFNGSINVPAWIRVTNGGGVEIFGVGGASQQAGLNFSFRV